MTERETEIFHIIQQNPAISQNELAAKLNLARSSVAVHIANLQKKGYILGKGYIVNESAYVLGVGAANVDIHGRSKKPIVMHDSNPGHMNTSAGGVTRNVCENLSRLGVSVKLISAVGTDVYADQIRRECQSAGIDISNLYVADGKASSTYMSMIDADGDMFVALSDMTVLQGLPLSFLSGKQSLIRGARLVTCDRVFRRRPSAACLIFARAGRMYTQTPSPRPTPESLPPMSDGCTPSSPTGWSSRFWPVRKSATS